MGTFYDSVKVGSDLAGMVRSFFANEDGSPVVDLVVDFKLRDGVGSVQLLGSLVEMVGAPGWYQLPSFVVVSPGLYTVEYNPPAGFAPDADTVRVESKVLADVSLDLQFLRDFTAGNWKITGNQMVFFREGQPTVELMRFNLFDKLGTPSEEVVFERRRP